ncbi:MULTISPECIES: aspartyl/asparaginyl beta-hydroxylase domain-containing protein [Burkholderia]|uniref:Aspartyl beta-hydroxylase n=2 Tax=Burkholderia gladioli TaxID=28095 RepID=A0A2A7SIP1_BURGA|nr:MULTISPECIES: aspartyl/asparaginyl beta-hydroxylase domain-containing protein [Burkholderia]ATF88621.1 aspartyl beta-hydroxylase [Burkholderia gladioli pv. gladioli]MBJ9665727.1 aspartyl/asparaginyl beta-hydroxylase domain-containing protein [Burkholderia gladioli]MBJ9716161.1 aspartyl/asparaginyl beta-hydroxylase domain-containing protein [Burkholderia gladioli]MBU9156654.1 aspartyl/asparaginyl beta-hydroxylase domain-containing protein [Burkholderia gladioli]MBU9172796.1 aspartyl/asparagi
METILQDQSASFCQHVPESTPRPAFYPLEQFPRLNELAAQWEIIRDEFLELNAPTLDIDRVGKSHVEVYAETLEHVNGGGEYGWLMGWGEGEAPNPDWTAYGLVAYDEPISFAEARMPKTLALLKRIEGIKICALQRMGPNVFLNTHRHPELHDQDMLQLHITIDAATERDYAYLNVAGHFNQNRIGNAIVFDGSLDHFALNASPSIRTILYMEFERDKQMAP